MPRSKYSFPFDEMMSESLVDLQALSSSFPLRKPSIMSVQSAWKTLEKAVIATSNNNAANQEYQLSESEFPFLDSKPEVDEYKLNKGRRNASDQLLQKKIAGQAYVLKVVGQGQRSKAIGKKRRARLLSENCEDMKINVPYSMNRKNRWEVESSSEYLKDRRSDENVQLSALDQHFTAKGLSTNKDVLAFHQVNEDGTLTTRKSQSQRGSALTQLNSSESEEKPLTIRYVLAKAQTNGKCLMTGSLDKAKPLSRSTKRAQLDVSVYSTDNDEMNDDEIGLLSPNSSVQSEETQRMYLPKQQTYTLADFIMDKQGDPVVVRAQRRHVPLDSFVQVEMPDVQEESDRQIPPSPMTKMASISSLFKTFHVPAKSLGIKKREDWLRLSDELKTKESLYFHWLNNANSSFQVDLTSQLLKMTSNTPHLVATMAYEEVENRVRLLLNASQHCQASLPVIEAGLRIKLNGLEGLLQTVVNNAKISKKSENFGLSTEHGPEFNSSQLSQTVHPKSDYALLYPQQNCPAEIGIVKNSDDKAAIEDEEDDFEHIDMDQFIDSDQQLDTKWCDSALDDQVNQMKTICVECGECETTKIVLINGCGHSFCTKCLKASMHQQICESVPELKCSFKNCSTPIQPSILLSIFQLPVVTLALHSCALVQANQQQKRLFKCPAKCGLVLVDQETNKFGQIQCSKCNQHVCLQCLSTPHFPMTCEQNAIWSQKRALQSQKIENEGNKKAVDNEINQQFWSICNEARKKRMDAQQSRKIGKDVLKRVGYKLERAFLNLRMACLQIVENGYAWLYMTRNQRPQNWSSAKNLIGILYKELHTFENSLLYGANQTAEKVEENVQKMRSALRKTILEIQ